MIYARINADGEVIQYPTDGDHDMDVEVVDVEAPALVDGQTLDEAFPVNDNGVYIRNWLVHDWLEIDQAGLYLRVGEGGEIIYPYTANDVRRDFSVAGRAGSIKQMDGQWGVLEVERVEAPEPESGEVVEEAAAPDEYEPGKWRQVWTIRDMTPDEKRALIPVSVTMRQARIMAERAGILEQIESIVAGIGKEAQIEWEYALEVRLDHPLIAHIGSALNMTEEEIGEMFIGAAGI